MAGRYLCIAALAILFAVSADAQAAGGRRQLRDAFCSPKQETDFLLTFKSARNYDPTGVLSTWSPGREMCGEWEGIVCSETGHVTDLDVRKQGLDGPLPDGFSCFGQLEQLTLGGNDFTGTLPAAWSAATALTRIRLKNSELMGSLPEEWTTLGDIRAITVSNNEITGMLPEAWAALQALKVLDAKKNDLSGTIPAAYGDLEQLESVNLHSNNLQGEIPFDDDVEIIFLPQNTPSTDPTESPAKECVFENKGWTVLPRPNAPAPGYHAEFLGLIHCFVECPTTDVIVWSEETQLCQCWDTDNGFFSFTGFHSVTAFVLSDCSTHSGRRAVSLAPNGPDPSAATPPQSGQQFDKAAFLLALRTLEG